jgi:hypothetical protein
VPEPIANAVMANLVKEKRKRAADARALGRSLMEAAKAAGLSPEDLVPRSVLLGGRPGVVQLASMQRTGQLQLDRPLTEITPGDELPFARGAPGAIASLPSKTAYVTPVNVPAPDAPPQMVTVGLANRIAPVPPSALPPLSAATQKWVPPASVQAQMAAGVPPAPISSVDLTMDDATAQLSPALPPVSQRSLSPAEDSGAQVPGARAIAPTAFDESVDEPAPPAPAHRWRTPAAVLLAVVASAMVATVAVRSRGTGGAASPSPVDGAVARAEDALKRERFDDPPGDNVRDLTNDALVKWPNDARILGVRSRACDAALKEATRHQAQGDLLAAQKLVKLAEELDPASGAARDLAAQVDALAHAAAAPPTLAWPDAGRVASSPRGTSAGASAPRRPAATLPAVPAGQGATPPAAATVPPPPPPPAKPASSPAPSASVKWL